MEHLTFDDMRLFARVAALGSFSAVARERLVAVTRVSRCVERMEQACGATLVARGSQGVRLTAEGEVFLAACAQAEGLLDEARLGRLRGFKVAQKAGSMKTALSQVKDWFVGNF